MDVAVDDLDAGQRTVDGTRLQRTGIARRKIEHDRVGSVPQAETDGDLSLDS